MNWAERSLRLVFQALGVLGVYGAITAVGVPAGVGVPTTVALATVAVAFGYPLLARLAQAVTWRVLFGRRPSPHRAVRQLIDHAMGPGPAGPALERIKAIIRNATGARGVVITDDQITLLGVHETPTWGGVLRPLTAGVLIIARNARLEQEIADRLAANAERAEQIAAARQRLDAAEQLERGRMEQQILRTVVPALEELAAALDANDQQKIAPLAEQALERVRATGRGLHPPILRDLGLAAAIRSIAAGQATIDGSADGRFAAEVESAAYRYCVAALQTPNATIQVNATETHLLVAVQNARDVDADRILAVGGEVTVHRGGVEARIPR